MKAIIANGFGGPEVLQYVDVDDPSETPGYKLLKNSLISINYADTHQTENSYMVKALQPGFIPGTESVGIDKNGDRFLSVYPGAYAEKMLVPNAFCFEIPEHISNEQAAACSIQGITAYKLTENIKSGQVILIYGASSGVGTIAIQLAKIKGAKIIAITSEEKTEYVKSLGADLVFTKNPNIKCDLILDMIGGSGFLDNINSLNPKGKIIIYGSASRESTTLVDPQILMSQNKTIEGFWLQPYFGNHQEYQKCLNIMFDLVKNNSIKIISNFKYRLSDAMQAHRDILDRKTFGKVCLIP